MLLFSRVISSSHTTNFLSEILEIAGLEGEDLGPHRAVQQVPRRTPANALYPGRIGGGRSSLEDGHRALALFHAEARLGEGAGREDAAAARQHERPVGRGHAAVPDLGHPGPVGRLVQRGVCGGHAAVQSEEGAGIVVGHAV